MKGAYSLSGWGSTVNGVIVHQGWDWGATGNVLIYFLTVRWLLLNSRRLMSNANARTVWMPIEKRIGVWGKNAYNLTKYERFSMYMLDFPDQACKIEQHFLSVGESKGFGRWREWYFCYGVPVGTLEAVLIAYDFWSTGVEQKMVLYCKCCVSTAFRYSFCNYIKIYVNHVCVRRLEVVMV